jgi:hypothetical protein
MHMIRASKYSQSERNFFQQKEDGLVRLVYASRLFSPTRFFFDNTTQLIGYTTTPPLPPSRT